MNNVFLSKIADGLKRYFLIILPLALLLPSFEVAGINIRFENLIALVLLPILIKQIYKKEFDFNLFDLGFVLLGLSFVVTITYSYLFKNVPFYSKDLLDVIRIVNYYLIYRYCYYFFSMSGNREAFKKYYLYSMSLVVGVAIMQYFDLLGVNRLLRYYTTEFHIRGVIRNGRVIGTFGHTNELALFVGIFLLFLVSQLLFNRYAGKEDMKKRLISKSALMFFSFFCLFATMSRSMLVAVFTGLAALLFFYLVFSNEKDKIKRTLFTIVIVVFTAFSSFGLIKYQADSINRINVIDRFEAGAEELGAEGEFSLESMSFSKRLEQWVKAADVISENPFLGYGPSKATKGSDSRPVVVENEYLGIMMNYGLLGLLGYLYLYLIILWMVFRGLAKKKEAGVLSYNLWALGAVTAVLVYNIFLGVFFRTQAFDILLVMFALIVSINKDELSVSGK